MNQSFIGTQSPNRCIKAHTLHDGVEIVLDTPHDPATSWVPIHLPLDTAIAFHAYLGAVIDRVKHDKAAAIKR